MLRNREHEMRSCGVIFYPALTPLEAAMLPARTPRDAGALRHVRAETARRFRFEPAARGQRTKIWVR